jgi:biotin carboxyl carrier protein
VIGRSDQLQDNIMEFEYKYFESIHKVMFEKSEQNSGVSEIIKAQIDSQPVSFDISRISENCLLILKDSECLKMYVAATDTRIYVHLNGRVITLEKIDSSQKTFSKELMEFGSKDQVTTPMPGKVVKILVKEGEKINLKQPLVIVESMKMENEIKSPSNGTVKSIHFKAGDLVETGQPIIKIEPEN